MGRSRRNRFGTCLHIDVPWHVMSSVLLVLAVLGYGGLPSNPPSVPTAEDRILFAGTGCHLTQERYVAPVQAKEYRQRTRTAEHREIQTDDPAAIPAGLPALIASTLAAPAEVPLASRPPDVAPGLRARAPPSASFA